MVGVWLASEARGKALPSAKRIEAEPPVGAGLAPYPSGLRFYKIKTNNLIK
jgi:hypothetical protein